MTDKTGNRKSEGQTATSANTPSTSSPSIPPASGFARLCGVLAEIMQTRSSNRKISLFAEYLKALEDDRDLSLAVQFTAEGAFSTLSGKRASVGHRTVALTAAEFCGVDYDVVFRPCRTATGSASEAIEKLMRNLPEAAARRNPAWLGLDDVANGFEQLAAATGREQKQQILAGIWEQMTPREIRFMIRMLGQGSLRIGFEVRSILPAIARACGADPEQVRRVHMLTGEIGKTALLARSGKLKSARFRMFQPVAFMLASPAEAGNVGDPQAYVAEEKFDGMRAQVHVGLASGDGPGPDSGQVAGRRPHLQSDTASGSHPHTATVSSPRPHPHCGQISDQGSAPILVRLYSRDLNDVTGTFPDVAVQLRDAINNAAFTGDHVPDRLPSGQSEIREPDALQSSPGEVVLDGELCVLEDGHIQPFQRLQKRMGVKKPGKKLLAEHPVRFIAYDMLFLNGEEVIDLPLHLRRKRLEEFCKQTGLPFSRQHAIASESDIDRLFAQALKHGNEGLMLKRRDSIYEFGQRNKSWLKVKQPAGSLDTVIMYAHAGSGRRGGTYSDFTLGIRVDEDDRYEEQFIPIGKAYGGYTDEELKKLNRRIKELAVERFGPTLSLRPGIVVEVEFDDIQVNRRTKAGYTLRLPRFRAIRWDLSPSDTDTLADVEQMYRLRAEGGGTVDPSRSPVLYQNPGTL